MLCLTAHFESKEIIGHRRMHRRNSRMQACLLAANNLVEQAKCNLPRVVMCEAPFADTCNSTKNECEACQQTLLQIVARLSTAAVMSTAQIQCSLYLQLTCVSSVIWRNESANQEASWTSKQYSFKQEHQENVEKWQENVEPVTLGARHNHRRSVAVTPA